MRTSPRSEKRLDWGKTGASSGENPCIWKPDKWRLAQNPFDQPRMDDGQRILLQQWQINWRDSAEKEYWTSFFTGFLWSPVYAKDAVFLGIILKFCKSILWMQLYISKLVSSDIDKKSSGGRTSESCLQKKQFFTEFTFMPCLHLVIHLHQQLQLNILEARNCQKLIFSRGKINHYYIFLTCGPWRGSANVRVAWWRPVFNLFKETFSSKLVWL